MFYVHFHPFQLITLYQKLIYWEIQLEDIEDAGMFEILESQKIEANIQFAKFIEKNYADWFHQYLG